MRQLGPKYLRCLNRNSQLSQWGTHWGKRGCQVWPFFRRQQSSSHNPPIIKPLIVSASQMCQGKLCPCRVRRRKVPGQVAMTAEEVHTQGQVAVAEGEAPAREEVVVATLEAPTLEKLPLVAMLGVAVEEAVAIGS